MGLLSGHQRETVNDYLTLSGSDKLIKGPADELVAANALRQPTQLVVLALVVTTLSALMVALRTNAPLLSSYVATQIQAGVTKTVDFDVSLFKKPQEMIMWLIVAYIIVAGFLIWLFVRTWKHRYASVAVAVLQLHQGQQMDEAKQAGDVPSQPKPSEGRLNQ